MIRRQQSASTLLGIGMFGLGILALIYGDFALVWQPVAPWIPARTALAYASGVLMLLCGAGLLFQATSRLSVNILFPYLIVWLLLKVPALVVAPQMLGVWLGFGELAVLLAGGWVLFARLVPQPQDSALRFVTSRRGVRAARLLFAASLIPIGLSHIVYVKQTAALVPPWLVFRTELAYATGIAQIACGIAVMCSIYPRLATAIEAAMLSSFALLVWGPAILDSPAKRLPWTAFFISWVIAAAAWVLATEDDALAIPMESGDGPYTSKNRGLELH